uniref:Uncharacterized protein n=1 Tax=Cacopsylla melanoneura TaxID=428564 RepID=A0A8D8S0S6_9HEMI
MRQRKLITFKSCWSSSLVSTVGHAVSYLLSVPFESMKMFNIIVYQTKVIRFKVNTEDTGESNVRSRKKLTLGNRKSASRVTSKVRPEATCDLFLTYKVRRKSSQSQPLSF